MEKIKVGVVGATGYAGAEICRLIAGKEAILEGEIPNDYQLCKL